MVGHQHRVRNVKRNITYHALWNTGETGCRSSTFIHHSVNVVTNGLFVFCNGVDDKLTDQNMCELCVSYEPTRSDRRPPPLARTPSLPSPPLAKKKLTTMIATTLWGLSSLDRGSERSGSSPDKKNRLS